VPHHGENCDNVSNQADDVIPDSQRGSLCTRSEVSHFESVGYDKEGSSSAGASDPAAWPGVMNWNVRGYLIQIGPPTITTEISPKPRVRGRFNAKE